jgi:hypothetical protein
MTTLTRRTLGLAAATLLALGTALPGRRSSRTTESIS